MSNSLPQSLVLIGAGKMGGAMLEGWLRIGIDPKGISLIDPKPSDEMVALAQEKGMRVNPSAKEIPAAEVVVLATFPIEGIARDQLEKAKVPVEARPLRAVEPDGDRVRLVLEGGERVVDRVFAHPPQCQTELVDSLKLAVDDHGSVVVDVHYETSVPGVHAAGDLMTRVHSAQVAAGNGAAAAYAVNFAVTLERVVEGSL